MTKNTTNSGLSFAEQFQIEVSEFILNNPDISQIHVMCPDMNGIMRGKSIPIASLEKLTNGSVKMPLSSHGLSVWGRDVDGTGLALATGDPDGVFVPILGSLSVTPHNRKLGQVMAQLHELPQSKQLIDPRDILENMLKRFSGFGLKPVLAAELEFYLMSDETPPDGPPLPVLNGKVQRVNEIDALVDQQSFIDSVRECCLEQDIAIDTIIAEYGRGQFEINMQHSDDVLKAADHVFLFKHLVRHCAKKHGMRATFMAKPMVDQPGSGMHVHLSVLNDKGENIFASATQEASPKLLNAIAGVLDSMVDFQAIFAPHMNSYRRFQAHSHAPTNLSWGYDHRGVAIRIPEVCGKNARLEHRVCGADVNPYLALAAILAGVLNGLEAQLTPTSATAAGAEVLEQALTNDWKKSIRNFENSDIAKSCFGSRYQNIYVACRYFEIEELNLLISNVEYEAYLFRI